jgi:diketogulonate reductase-like aldo/keto reductase
VSNFQIAHLQRLLTETQVVPAVNQVELHTRLQQEPLRRFHAEHGIVTEAWSPLGQGQALQDPAVVELARRHGRTPAQVVLRWHVQLGNVVIPKSTSRSRIRENIALFDFELDDADMAALAGLEAGERLGPDPDERDTRPREGFSSTGGRWVRDVRQDEA